MDFNEANSILKRIKREYKAFEDLEALVQYCIDLENSKTAMVQAIENLKAERAQAEADHAQAVFAKDAALDELQVVDSEYKTKLQSLEADYKATEADFKSQLADLKEEIARTKAEAHAAATLAKAQLKEFESKIAQAQAKLAEAQAKYDEFKRAL